MQGFLNLVLRRLFKSRGKEGKGCHNSDLFLAVVTVLMLFTEEIGLTSHAFSGLYHSLRSIHVNMRVPLLALCFYPLCLIAGISAVCGTMLTVH